ncbi:unnamed protein product [Closterium sp. Naga37s-1]|nr:unnamed protein product [Closterium sp. Naga37s-1]
MAVSLAGPSYYPSAAYATVNGETAAGDVVVAAAGRGRALDDYSAAGDVVVAAAGGAALDDYSAAGDVVVAAAGGAALDDYSGYMEAGGTWGFAAAVRYGDYMTAGIDEEGNAWGAVQYVAGETKNPLDQLGYLYLQVAAVNVLGGLDGKPSAVLCGTVCAGEAQDRTHWSNWATYIFIVQL